MRRYVQDLPDEVICDGPSWSPSLSAASSRSPFQPTVPAEPSRASPDGAAGRDHARPRDPVDRQLITVNDLSARMISQHSFCSYVTVVEQLWPGTRPSCGLPPSEFSMPACPARRS
jgi:hypothetical protein